LANARVFGFNDSQIVVYAGFTKT